MASTRKKRTNENKESPGWWVEKNGCVRTARRCRHLDHFHWRFFCAHDLILTPSSSSLSLSPITPHCWIADGSFILDILFSFTWFSSHRHCRRLPIVLFSVFIIIFPVISSSLFIYTFHSSFLLSPFAIVECIRFGLNCCGNSDERERKTECMYRHDLLMSSYSLESVSVSVCAASKCMASIGTWLRCVCPECECCCSLKKKMLTQQ